MPQDNYETGEMVVETPGYCSRAPDFALASGTRQLPTCRPLASAMKREVTPGSVGDDLA